MTHDPENDKQGRRQVDPPGRRYSGYIIVALTAKVTASDQAKDLFVVAEAAKLVKLRQLLIDLGRPFTQRLITSVDPAKLRSMEETRPPGGKRQQISLTRFWRVGVTNVPEPALAAAQKIPKALPDLARVFAGLPGVETAYAELVAGDPHTRPDDDPMSAQQRHLDRAPRGIDARFAWQRAGGAGQEVVVCDLEQAWFPHDDIPWNLSKPLANHNRRVVPGDEGGVGTAGGHGTAVVGVIAAADNTIGVIGIAPSIRELLIASHFRPAVPGGEPLHVADAIAAALDRLAAGNVLLLEVQRDRLPTEVDRGDREAVALAYDRGVIVVEAAGNGGSDLDGWQHEVYGFHLRPGHDDFFDSGAVLVGSAHSEVELDAETGLDGHRCFDTSNFGTRIDCYAWGEDIVTCGGDLRVDPFAPPEVSYTVIFAETSGAAAIIAGAAASTQGMHLAASGRALTPAEMRDLLAKVDLGTPCITGAGEVGSMPDLRRIGTNGFASVPLPDID